MFTHNLTFLRAWLICGLEYKYSVLHPHHMRGNFSRSSFQALKGQGFKPEPGTVVRRSLLGISHPPLNMVEAKKSSPLWFRSLVFIVGTDRTVIIWRHGSIILFCSFFSSLTTQVRMVDQRETPM